MTEKQKKCIEWICGLLEIEYEGENTKKDAWKFINEHIEQAKAYQKEINFEHAVETAFYAETGFSPIAEYDFYATDIWC